MGVRLGGDAWRLGSGGGRVEDIFDLGCFGSGGGYVISPWFGKLYKISNPLFSDPPLFQISVVRFQGGLEIARIPMREGYAFCLWFARFWKVSNPLFSDPPPFSNLSFSISRGA